MAVCVEMVAGDMNLSLWLDACYEFDFIILN